MARKKIKIKGETGSGKEGKLTIEIDDAPAGTAGAGTHEPDVQAYQDGDSFKIISNGKILTITIAE